MGGKDYLSVTTLKGQQKGKEKCEEKILLSVRINVKINSIIHKNNSVTVIKLNLKNDEVALFFFID